SATVKHTLNLSVFLALEVEANFPLFLSRTASTLIVVRFRDDPRSTASANWVFCTIRESLKTVCFSSSTKVLSLCMANRELDCVKESTCLKSCSLSSLRTFTCLLYLE